MATRKTAAPAGAQGQVPARVLRDCWLGRAGQIVTLDAEVADAARGQGAVDLHPAALQEDGDVADA